MHDMFSHFKKDIENVIHQYEKIFEKKKKSMSDGRSTDIVTIKGILKESEMDFDRCRQMLVEKLKQFKTGWWIFKTGNSRLRNQLLDVLNMYNQPLVQLLMTKLSNHENSKLIAHKTSATKPITQLEVLITTKDKMIKTLQEEVQRKQKALREAMQKQTELEIENLRLKQAIELENAERNITFGSMKF